MGAKADLYKSFRSLADEGRAVLWYSTEDAEFAECDRTLVLRDGAVVAEFSRGQTSEERPVEASFRKLDERGGASQAQLAAARARHRDSLIWAMIPPVTFAIVFTLCVAQNPLILSAFGLTLVFSAAFALSLRRSASCSSSRRATLIWGWATTSAWSMPWRPPGW